MCFKNSSLIVFIAWLIVKEVHCGDYSDAPAATNDQLYGKGNCCFFAYDEYCDINMMHDLAPSAKKFATALLPKYKIAYTENPDGVPYVTAVQDGNSNLYGIAYTMSMKNYAVYLKWDSITDGKRSSYAVTMNVIVILKGKATYINCNTFLSINQVQKLPPKDIVRYQVEGFTAAGFFRITLRRSPNNQHAINCCKRQNTID